MGQEPREDAGSDRPAAGQGEVLQEADRGGGGDRRPQPGQVPQGRRRQGIKYYNPKWRSQTTNFDIGGQSTMKKGPKKPQKKKTSDTIKRAIPHRKPNSVMEVCRPCTAPSREISRHHWIITNMRVTAPNINNSIESK